MTPTLAAVVWILLLLAQILSTPVSSAPTNGVGQHLQKVTGAEESSVLKKKTTVSVNGKVLPLAALSATDKNIHVTLQQSPQDSQQGTPLQPGQVVDPLQQSSPQPLVQEVAPGTSNSQVNLQGNQEPLRSPANLQVQEIPNSLSSLPQAPGQGQQPLRSPPNIQLEERGIQQSLSNLPQAPGTFHSPPILNTPSSLNAGQEQQPFHSPPTTQGQVFLSPPLTSVQGLPQGTLNSPQNLQGQSLLSSNPQRVPQGTLANQQIACNTALNNQNPQTATTLMNLGQNSEGQLTYKPLRC